MFGGITNLFSGGQSSGYGDLAAELEKGAGLLKNMYAKGRGYLNPFYHQGLNAFNQYSHDLFTNPAAEYDRIMSGYQESPGAKFQMQQDTQAANNAGAASGMVGSGAEQKQLAKYSQGIVSQDQNDYMHNVLAAMSPEQQMAMMGYNAGTQMNNSFDGEGNELMDAYGHIGQAMAGQDEANASGIGNMIGFGMGALNSIGL